MPLALILHVCQDPTLLDGRRSILRAAGYVVESALSVKPAIDQFLAGDFDLVLLCHSIPAQDRNRLVCLIRASGSFTPLISIVAMSGQVPDAFAEATIESTPEKLLSGIRKVLRKADKAHRTQESIIPGK
jgi:DNA-binding response OmpR family regulator